MNLETSKKCLKVLGILSLIFGILGVIGGIALTAGGGLIGIGTVDTATNGNTETIQNAIGVAVFGGLFIIVASAINIIAGCLDIRAAKDVSKIMPAWVFAIIGLIMCVIQLVGFFNTKDFSGSTVTGMVLNVLLSVLTFVAANTIKKAAGK